MRSILSRAAGAVGIAQNVLCRMRRAPVRRSDVEADQSGELAVGDPAPDFRLSAGDGREIALSAYRGKAHVVLFFVRAYG
jgi:hypothetical protein